MISLEDYLGEFGCFHELGCSCWLGLDALIRLGVFVDRGAFLGLDAFISLIVTRGLLLAIYILEDRNVGKLSFLE